MKLKAFLALTLMGTLSATAQVTTDTVTTVENARRVVVTERDSVVNIDIFGNGTDPTFRYSYSKSVGKNAESVVRQSADDWDFNILFGKKKKEQQESNKWQKELGMFGLAMGWVATPGMPDGLKAKMSKSAEFYLDILNVNFQRHHHALAIHTGFYTASLCHEGKQLRYGKNASHGLAPEAPHPRRLGADRGLRDPLRVVFPARHHPDIDLPRVMERHPRQRHTRLDFPGDGAGIFWTRGPLRILVPA